MQFGCGFLLQRRGRERRCRSARNGLFLHCTHTQARTDALLEETARLFRRCKTRIQHAVRFHAADFQLRVDAVIGLRLERGDFPLAVHHQAERHGLHATGGQALLDLAPQNRRQFEAHQAVQRTAGLLRVHQVIVDVPRMLHGFQNGVFGNLVEDDAAGAGLVQPEHLGQVPGDGLPFAVLIRSQPDGLCRIGGLFQFGDEPLLVFGDFVFGTETVRNVHTQFLLCQVADVSAAGFHLILLPQELSDGIRLGRRLYNH